MGARQLLAQAVESEVQELLAEHAERRTLSGHAGVVRNGYLPERELQTGLGLISVKIPKVRAKCGTPVTFQSALVPPYVRNTATLEAALPMALSEGCFQRRDGISAAGVGGSRGAGAVGQYRQPPEAGMGRRVPALEPTTAGQRPLGVCLG